MHQQYWKEIPGFSWPMLSFFREAISSYHFTHGDTVYRSLDGYQAGLYLGQRIMVRTTEAQRRADDVERDADEVERFAEIPRDQEAQANKEPKRNRRLAENWASPITLDFFEKEEHQQFHVTQGHLYTLLWKGNDSILLDTTSPPLPERASNIVSVFRICQNQNSPYYMKKYAALLDNQPIRAVLSTLSVRLRDLCAHAQPRSYFCLPFDLAETSSLEKQERVSIILKKTHGAILKSFTLSELHFPQAELYAPTTRIATMEMSSTISSDEISRTLQPYLYVPNPKVLPANQRFRLDKHGIMVDHA